MLAVELPLALGGTELGLAILIAVALSAALLVPYLLKEIRRGKVELGPRTPTGTGDNHRVSYFVAAIPRFERRSVRRNGTFVYRIGARFAQVLGPK